MQVFLVSVRTALIYGPGELLEARAVGGNQMYLQLNWPDACPFDEWEGYAVVAPERQEVWGLSQPGPVVDGVIAFEFLYSPQPIPPQDRKLFPQKKTSKPATKAQDDEVWSFYQEEGDRANSSAGYQDPAHHPDTFQRQDEV